MHMQHRDTWNPHLYSGTGTSQRVCHQPASKLECRTNAHAAQRHLESTLVFGYGYLAKSLPSTRFQAGVPHECQRTLHVGQHTPLLADENAPRRSIPRWGVCLHTVQGHCRRLAVAWLSEPFALGTVCSRNRALQRRVCRRAGSAFPETSADGTEQALGALLLCALALAVRAPFVGGGQFSTKSQKVPIAVLSQRSGLLKLGL